MDICVISGDAKVARFIVLELTEAGYDATAGDFANEAQLYICDLDTVEEIPGGAIGFSYYEAKRELVGKFIRRPIDAAELKATVASVLLGPEVKKSPTLEISSATRKVKSELGEVRLSEKEFALLKMLCNTPLLTRKEGAEIFGDGDSNVVDVYIHYLRRKLSKISSQNALLSKRGIGYSLSSDFTVKFI